MAELTNTSGLRLQILNSRLDSNIRLEEDEFMAAAAGAAAAAAIANAIKASGVLIRVAPNDFQTILRKVENPLVIYAESGFFSTTHIYLVSYKGFAFFTKSSEQILLPPGVETIVAAKVWLPQ
jgi:hypothetical protein